MNLTKNEFATGWGPEYWPTAIQGDYVDFRKAFTWTKWLNLVGVPVFLAAGFVGNTLSIIIMCHQTTRRSSYGLFLLLLGISDNIIVIGRSMGWISGIYKFFTNSRLFTIQSSTMCRFTSEFFMFGEIVSGWMVASFSIQRAIVVSRPFSNSFVTSTRAKRTIAFFVMCIGLFVMMPFHLQITYVKVGTYEGCLIPSQTKKDWLAVLLMVALLIPLVSSSVANTIIIARLFKSSKIRSNQDTSKTSSNVAIMLLIISTNYIVLTLPAWTLNEIIGLTVFDYTQSDLWIIFIDIAEFLFNANYCINFYIYILSGRELREILKMTITKCRFY